MATTRELQILDEIWERVSRSAGYLGTLKLSHLLQPQESTNGPLNLYVSVDGNDGNPGTQDQPFRTLQAAIRSVYIGNEFKRRITINVGAGNFAGAIIDGIHTLIPDDPSTQYSGLEIRGTMVPFEVAGGGTNSGTITAYTAVSGANEAVITDDTQNWAVNSLQDRFVVLKSGTGFPGTETLPPILPIVSNTATTITVRGPTTAVGATYEIQDCATVFNSASSAVASFTGSVSGASLASAVFIMGANMGGAIGFSRFRISLGTGVTQGINGLGMAGYRMVACQIFSATGQGVSSPINAGNLSTGRLDSGRLDITQCVIQAPNNATAINMAGSSSTQHSITQCSLRGLSTTSASGVACGGDSKLLMTFCTLKALTNGVSFTRAHTGGLILTSLKIDGTGGGTTTGINMAPVGSSLAQPGGSFVCTNVDISNCTTAITMSGRNSLGWLVSCTGTGNTNGIVLAQGAALKVAAAVTLTGTAEVALDGAAATTLANMRAASPKLLTNTYATIIHE